MTVATQILQDGPRNAVFKFTNDNGDTESAVLKVDVSTLSGFNGRIPTAVRIEKIEYSLTGMSVSILWDATADVLAWELTPDADNEINFRSAPLVNNAGAGVTGDILFTTIGGSAGDSYSIILHMVKVYH
jgi:hypothetical protein